MIKTYIDIPVVAYQTWLLAPYLIDNEGQRIDDDDNEFVNSLERMYPERPGEPHISR